MNPARQVAIGFGVMIAGLVVIAVGVAVARHDLVVGLILLLLVPLSVSFCGAILALVGLLRQPEARSRSAVIRRIIGEGVLGGVGFGFGFAVLSTLSQLPDWFAGLNGTFLPGAGLSIFPFAGMCLLVGLGVGSLIALIWWTRHGRHQPATAVVHSPR